MQIFGDSIKVIRDEIKEFHHCNDALEININILTTLVLCTKELFVMKTFLPQHKSDNALLHWHPILNRTSNRARMRRKTKMYH